MALKPATPRWASRVAKRMLSDHVAAKAQRTNMAPLALARTSFRRAFGADEVEEPADERSSACQACESAAPEPSTASREVDDMSWRWEGAEREGCEGEEGKGQGVSSGYLKRGYLVAI